MRVAILIDRAGIGRLLCAAAACLLLAASPAAYAEDAPPDTLKIVFIAYQNPGKIVEDIKPVVAYLEETLGIKVKDYVATDYAGVVEALRNKSADMGFMGPLQYVMAHKYAGAYPILGEVYGKKASYVSRIFVRKDSGIKTLEDLRGKSIAFTDPLSSSGYLYPLDLFKEKGLVKEKPRDFFRRTYFAGGDEQAIRAVLNKFVDSAGIGQFAYGLLRPDERDALTYVGESRPLPSHCVVVRKDLNTKTVKAVQDALFALNDGPNKGLLKNLYGVDGYVKVTHETFKEVEEVARIHGFLKGD